MSLVNYATVDYGDPTALELALRIQYGRDLAPSWGVWGQCQWVSRNQIPATSMVLGFFDTADQANALGYHDLTPLGLPVGKVFVKTSQHAGVKVSVVASHEMCEMVVDPFINRLVPDFSDPLKDWISEVCDPVEDDADGYDIHGVTVSDFVLPSYFNPDSNPPWDFKGVLQGPLPTLSAGGYLSYRRMGMWGQIFGAQRKVQAPGLPGGSGRINRMMTWTSARRPPQRSTFMVRPVAP